MRVLRRVRRHRSLTLALVLTAVAALSLPAGASAANTVIIGNGSELADGSYLNAQNIANNLVFTSVAIQANTSISINEDISLSTSIYGIPAFDLSLIAPTININADIDLSQYGNVFITANTVNLNGRITSGGNPVNPSRVFSWATQVNVLSNAASIQTGIGISSRFSPATVQVSAGQYDESLSITKALTLRGNAGSAADGADPTAPEIFGTQAGGRVITVTANNVTVDGLHLNGVVAGGSLTRSVNGVYASGVDNLTVSQSTFEGFSGPSIETPGSSNVTLNTNLTINTLTDIAVTPANPAIANGTNQQFTATGTYSDASTADLTGSVTWASGSPAVATINSTGLAHATVQGTSTISATLGLVSGTTVLTVGPATLSAIVVTPANPAIPNGTDQQFAATGVYSDASTADLTGSVTWASGSPAVATITPAGLAQAAGQGTSTISATLGLVSGSTVLTVGPATLTAIAVTPANPAIANGTNQQFAATGIYSDASTADLTGSVTWASGSPAVATINSTGLAHAGGQGASTISATLGLVSGTTVLTVGPATLTAIAVTPANPAIANGTRPAVHGHRRLLRRLDRRPDRLRHLGVRHHGCRDDQLHRARARERPSERARSPRHSDSSAEPRS